MLNISKFQLDKIKPYSCIVAIGKRGKTSLMKDILLHSYDETPDMSSVIVQKKSTGEYDSCSMLGTKKRIVVDQFENISEFAYKNLQNIFSLQQMTDSKRMALVLEDCMVCDTAEFSKNKLLRRLFMTNRGRKMDVLLAMQYPMSVPPVIRANFDYVFLFRENAQSTKRTLWALYAGMFTTFEEFEQVFDQITSDQYSCMVIHLSSSSSKLEECVFWYKSEFGDE